MKTELRLGSIVTHGVGGPECGAIELIYIYLLHEFGQDIYSRIGINQVGDDLEEFVMKESGNRIHVNIRFPVYEDFEAKSLDEKNKIRLDIIHTALLRIAEYDKKLEINRLDAIREKILIHNFSFEFIYKAYRHKNNPSLVSKIVIHPLMDKFIFYAVIENDGEIKCKQIIFTGIATFFYIDRYFFYVKWKSENELIIWGKEKTVETHFFIDTCTIDVINLTAYENPPYYTLMKVGISDENREKANKDWMHSLPPHIAAAIRKANN